MNWTYDINRRDVLAAIRADGWFVDMGNDLPRDESAGEGTLIVPNRRGEQLKLVFRVMASGVANRIQAKCPECGKWMRFSGLKQHVGTMICKKHAASD